MIVISNTHAVGPIAEASSAEGKPVGEAGHLLYRAFLRFADDLFWWAEARRHSGPARRCYTEASGPVRHAIRSRIVDLPENVRWGRAARLTNW